MFATIRRYKVKSGSTPEVAQKVQSGLVPILSKQAGFLSYNAIDGGNDVAISVSLYADRAAADAANAAAAQWVQQNLAGLISAPEITVGEVIASSVQRV
jgi:hypothetical protein